jgi:mono/diheme cytochrome c family protein
MTQNQRVAGTVIAVATAAIVLFAAARSGPESAGHTRGANQTPVELGAAVFANNCAGCHYTDSLETKKGPGLKALFQREVLPASGRKPTAENVRSQIRNPYQDMPAFTGLSEGEVDGVIAYLQTL